MSRPSEPPSRRGRAERPQNASNLTFAHFEQPAGRDLLARTAPFAAWTRQRIAEDSWPFFRHFASRPGCHSRVEDLAGRSAAGINLAAADYLGLASHPGVRDAIHRALDELGPIAGGSEALGGRTTASLALERAVADWLQMEHVVLYPTGWAAGYAVLSGLVRPEDHVLLDRLAHNCLRSGARAATPKTALWEHNEMDSLRALLARTRAADADHAIVVVTEGLFSMDSDGPDLAVAVALCREYDATLMVDVAHDLGVFGPQGSSRVGEAGLLPQVDVIVGSFSKALAGNGGFVAMHHESAASYLRPWGPSGCFSTGISPMVAEGIRAAIAIAARRKETTAARTWRPARAWSATCWPAPATTSWGSRAPWSCCSSDARRAPAPPRAACATAACS
jgi:7-keto-8-aminopelargonate synthetase-like enzyme